MLLSELREGYGQNNPAYQAWIKSVRKEHPDSTIAGDEHKAQMVNWNSRDNELCGDWDGKKGVVYKKGSKGKEVLESSSADKLKMLERRLRELTTDYHNTGATFGEAERKLRVQMVRDEIAKIKAEKVDEAKKPAKDYSPLGQLKELPQPIGINGGSYTYWVDVTKTPLKFTASDGSVVDEAKSLKDIAKWMDKWAAQLWLEFLNDEESLDMLRGENIIRVKKGRTDQGEHEANMREAFALGSKAHHDAVAAAKSKGMTWGQFKKAVQNSTLPQKQCDDVCDEIGDGMLQKQVTKDGLNSLSNLTDVDYDELLAIAQL